MPDDTTAVTETYTDYVARFQTLDPRAVLPYYHLPCMFVSPRGVAVMTTPVEVEAVFAGIMADLSRRGYGRTALTRLRVRLLDETIALLSATGVRYRTDGEELEGLGATYTLRRVGAGWRIVLTTVHAPDVVALDR